MKKLIWTTSLENEEHDKYFSLLYDIRILFGQAELCVCATVNMLVCKSLRSRVVLFVGNIIVSKYAYIVNVI